MPEIASRTRKSRVSPFVFGRYGERMPPFEAELLRDRILACIESTIWQELQADALNNASLDDSGRLCKAACLFCHVHARSRSERSAYWGRKAFSLAPRIRVRFIDLASVPQTQQKTATATRLPSQREEPQR